MKANKVQGINSEQKFYPSTNFKSERVMLTKPDGHDEFINSEKQNKKRKVFWITGGCVLLGASALLAHKAGWFKRAVNKSDDILNLKEFKKVGEAKEYFEKLGIETDFRGATDEHLPMLNRIKENLKQLKEMGVKKDKPDSITISDWKNRAELEELNRNRGCVSEEYEPEYFAQTITSKIDKKKHIFINSNKPNFDMFRHEMGHVNDGSYDSYWHSKGITGQDFADKQLSILGTDEKVNRTGEHFNNIFYFHPKETNTSFIFPNKDMQTRYVHAQKLISKMQSETGCYAPELLHEQRAYVFEGLLQGKTFSDEVMLYYDFTGGARIPNLQINGMSYDDYIKSLYENKDLINKLRAILQITKL